MTTPPILTLTTDFGRADFHLGRLKGHLLACRPDLQLVDISHEIPNYDIVQAAFIFKKVWRHYPPATLHLLSVNDYYQPRGRFVALEAEGQFFVGPDNGIFSLIFGELPPAIHVIEMARAQDLRKYKKKAATHLPTQDVPSLSAIYAWAVGQLLEGGLESLGPVADKRLERIPFQPVIGKDYIRGSVVFIDKFDNALTNISRELFEQVGQGRGFRLQLRRNEPIDGLSFRYQDVPEGETLIKFNSDDELEIAINLGKAAGLMSIVVEDSVQVDFF